MAKTQAEIEAVKNAYLRYLGRPAENQAIADFSSSSISAPDRINELLYSPEFQKRSETLASPDILRRQQIGEQQLTDQQRAAQLESTIGTNAANAGAARLQDTLSRSFALQKENDPYYKHGIDAGARNQYLGTENARIGQDITKDLNLKLSEIASRLGAAERSVGEQRATLTANTGTDIIAAGQTYADTIRGNRAKEQQQQYANDLDLAKATPALQDALFGNLLQPLPEEIYNRIIAIYGGQ